MFRRRFLCAAFAASSLWLSACSPAAPSQLRVTQAQLAQALAQHFPKQMPIAGLLQLEMLQPQLQLLPLSNQLQTTLNVQLSGPVLRESLEGQMQVRWGLRYEPKDHSVRAERVEVLALDLQNATPAMADMVHVYGLRLAQQVLQDFPLYTVPADELALIESLGLRLGEITVTDQGLDVAVLRPSTGGRSPG